MAAKEERLQVARHLFDAKYGPVGETEFKNIFAGYKKSRYIMWALWAVAFLLADLSWAFLPNYNLNNYLGYFMVSPLLILSYFVPISLGRKFSPKTIYIRAIIHSYVNFAFHIIGWSLTPYFITYGSPPQAIALGVIIGMLAVGATIIDLHFYLAYYRFLKRIKLRGLEAKEEAENREIQPLYAASDAFLAHPQAEDGAQLLTKLNQVLTDCKSFKTLSGKLTEKLQVVTTKYQALVGVQDNLAKAEQLLANGNIGQASEIGQDPRLIAWIEDLNIAQYREQYEKLLPRIQTALKQGQEQIQAAVSQAVAAKDAGNFEKARQILREANIAYEHLTISSRLKAEFPFNYNQYFRDINAAENEISIYRALVECARKYARIHISELGSTLQMPVSAIEPILKNLITSGKIRATFDEVSKGIEFHFVAEEIDQLLKGFADWEGKKEGKKFV